MALAPIEVSYAYEGSTDAAVAERLITHVGATPGNGYGGKGKGHLLKRLSGYNAAAAFHPWLVLVDLDKPKRADDCAVTFRMRHLPKPALKMCFRVAVREVEAWLLADRERFSSYFAVPQRRVLTDPETADDPKAEVIEIARFSRVRDIRLDMVPSKRADQLVGPGYTTRIAGFALDANAGWRPEIAARVSTSLARCIHCLDLLVKETS